jgi:acetyl-CoA synthetase
MVVASKPVIDIRNLVSNSYDELYNRFKWNIPLKFNLGNALCDLHASGNTTALIYEDYSGRREIFSFAELKSLSNRFANYLLEVGARRGDRVVILLPQRPETAIALFAIYKIGGIAVTLSTLLGSDAIRFRLADSGARLAIVDGSARTKFRWRTETKLKNLVVVNSEPGEDEREFSESTSASQRFTVAETQSNDPAHLYYTSGTSGQPKGVLHAHRFMLGHIPCWQLASDLGPKDEDVYWTPADWAWIGGSGNVALPAWYFGMPVVAYDRRGKFEPETALSIIERYKVTCSYMPATALRMIMKKVDRPRRDFDLGKFRSILTGGEPLGKIIDWGQLNLGVHLNETYGQTEANLLVTSCAVLSTQKTFAAGKPCPGHVVEILDEHGTVLKANKIGEIAAKYADDPVIFLGYWSNPEATGKKFFDGWLLTGDLGYKDDEGYVHFITRADDLIKSSAYRIGPAEVEEVINTHPNVLESAVIGKQDPDRGQIVKAFVVLTQNQDNLDLIRNEIVELVKKKVAEFAYPREIEFVDQIPRTVTGKIKRFELRTAESASRKL